MIGLLKWYYGYKNFGDEVLLLGCIPYLFTHYQIDLLYIEAGDVVWLQNRLARHQHLLWSVYAAIQVVSKHTTHLHKPDEVFFWWGEVLTDGRPFPYNGWNYMLLYPRYIISWKFHLLGGIWTPTSVFSRLLRSFLLQKAKTIVVREKRSYDIVCAYTNNVVLYHDFAEDVFSKIISTKSASINQSHSALINVNPYIWSTATKEKIVNYTSSYTHALYFPAEIGKDDQYFSELQHDIPFLIYYDWTQKSLQEVWTDLQVCSGAIAARLHVLRIAKLLGIPFEALVYQEKISTFLATCSGELS